MASAPATSPDDPTAAVTGEAAFAARLGQRATPVVRTPLAASTLRGPGRLAGTFNGFNSRLGLSQTSRWTLEAAADASPDASVRPPINYWPWDADTPLAEADDGFVRRAADTARNRPRPPAVVEDEPDDFVPLGDARVDALRRLLSKPKKRPAAAAIAQPTADAVRTPATAMPARPVRRGLPQALHRRGTATPRAQPGDIARRLLPAPVDPRDMSQRPVAGATPTNLPAAAAQARAAESADRATDPLAAPVAERRRPTAEAPRTARPTTSQPPFATEPAPPGREVGATPAAQKRRPVDLGAAARQLRSLPEAAPPRRGAGPHDPGVSNASTPGRPAADPDGNERPSPRPPAGPAASSSGSPDATTETHTAGARMSPATPTGDDTIRRAAPTNPGELRPEPPPREATPTNPNGPRRETPLREATTTSLNEPRREPPLREATTTFPNEPRRETPPARPPVANGRIDGPSPVMHGPDLPATPSPSRPSGPPSAAGQDHGAERRSSGDTSAPWTAHQVPGEPARRAPGSAAPTGASSALSTFDARAPRPPAASAPAPSGTGFGDAHPPTAGPSTSGPRPAGATTASAAADRPTSDIARPEARRPVVDEPVRRTPSADAERPAATRPVPDRTITPRAERASGLPGTVPSADRTGHAAPMSAEARGAQSSSIATPWPVQRSIADSPSQIDLSARTRTPAGPASADPAASEQARSSLGSDLGARPAPPLSRRLRSVNDDERAGHTAPTPDAPAARYRPTWQGDTPGGDPGSTAAQPARPAPPTAAPASLTVPSRQNVAPSGNAASPGRAPSAPSVAPSANPASPTSPRPSVNSPTSPSGAQPSTSGAAPLNDSSPAAAVPVPGEEPSIVRRAPVGDAAVRPATAFAAELPTDARPSGADTPPSVRAGADPAVARPGSTPLNRAGADPLTSRPESTPLNRAGTNPVTSGIESLPVRPAGTNPATSRPESTPLNRAGADPVTSRPESTPLNRAGTDPVTSRPESTPLNRAGTDPLTSRPESTPVSPTLARPPQTVATRADIDVATATAATPLRPAPPAVRRTAADQGTDARPWSRADQAAAEREPGGHSTADAPVRRFESVLRRAPAAPAPLPVQWRPLASAIAGERRVRVSTNAASRAALQAAGKRAATTGDVIHLAQPLRGPADAPLLAHELTHVASPSPAPRFFDDDRDSPEERRAEMIADVIRRSPVLPRAGARAATPDLPVARSSRSSVTSPRDRRPDAAGATASVTADELVQRLAGHRHPADGAGTIRRTAEVSSRSAQANSAGMAPTAPPASRSRRSRTATDAASTIRRTVAGGSRSAAAAGGVTAATETIQRWGSAKPSSGTTRSSTTIGAGRDQGAPSTTVTDETNGQATSAAESSDRRTRGWPVMTNGTDSSTLRDLIDWIVEQVEDRVTRELERRGGRYRGEF